MPSGLLDVDIDPATLCHRTIEQSFDNIAGSLALSQPVLKPGVAAGKVARIAVGYWKTPTVSTYVPPSDTTQDYQIEGLAFGTRGGMLVRHTFPADGEYQFSIKSLRNGPFVADEKVEVSIDGERVHVFDYNDYKTANSIYQGDDALRLTIPVKGMYAWEPRSRPRTIGLARPAYTGARSTSKCPDRWLAKLSCDRLLRSKDPSAQRPTSPSLRKVLPASHPVPVEGYAPRIISTLARRYQRPSTAEDLEGIVVFLGRPKWVSSRTGSNWRCANLASPQFLVRLEAEPANLAPVKVIALAAWNWPPFVLSVEQYPGRRTDQAGRPEKIEQSGRARTTGAAHARGSSIRSSGKKLRGPMAVLEELAEQGSGSNKVSGLGRFAAAEFPA
jgi:hypothetical protein